MRTDEEGWRSTSDFAFSATCRSGPDAIHRVPSNAVQGLRTASSGSGDIADQLYPDIIKSITAADDDVGTRQATHYRRPLMPDRPDVLLIGTPKKFTVDKLETFVSLHVLERARNADSLIAEVG